MAYFKMRDGTLHGSYLSGKYVPPGRITSVVCDHCARAAVGI